ncbi:hypothetical protein [Deinococcus sp.]|uniref:hypothetical protein n=1 Tax=Deinococcus sp. TaxID=47478 RepID=UPI0025BDECFA|nr:hypothetical protein [Deinococcus sp.]
MTAAQRHPAPSQPHHTAPSLPNPGAPLYYLEVIVPSGQIDGGQIDGGQIGGGQTCDSQTCGVPTPGTLVPHLSGWTVQTWPVARLGDLTLQARPHSAAATPDDLRAALSRAGFTPLGPIRTRR